MQAEASEKEAAFDTWIEERLGDLRQLANEGDLLEKAAALVAAAPASRAARSARELVLQEVTPHLGPLRQSFFELFIMEPDGGTVLASTSPAEEGKLKTGHPYFDRGRTDLYLQGPYYSVDIAGPALTGALPLRSAGGRVIAVLAARLNLDTMNTIAQRRWRLHQSEDTFLVNAERVLLTQPRYIREPAVLQRTIDTEAVRRCVAGNDGVLVAPDYRDIPVITVYQWNAARQVCLVVEVDQAEALAPAHAFGRFVAQVGGLALFVSVGLAVLLAGTITRPLRRLHESVKGFGDGQFKEPLPASSNDELGLLAREFNRMALAIGTKEAELRQLTTGLEATVAQRTGELSRNETRLKQAQELAEAGSWEWDVVANTVMWSDEAFRIFGFAPGGCTPSYEQYLACIHPDDRPLTIEWIKSVIEKKGPARLDNRIVRPDGEVRAVHGRADVVLDDAGSVVCVFGTTQDITERKQREDKLRLFRSLLEQSADAIFVADPATTRITVASDSACRSLGYTHEEMLTRRVSDIETTFSDATDFAGRVPQQLAMGSLCAEGRQRRKDGSTFPVEISVSRVRGPEGDHLLAITRDITERKQAETALLQAKDAAEAANRAKSVFLATMSHDIRTPMNGVIGAIGLLLDGELTPRQHELATIARSSADALLILINDILDISKIEAGKMPIEQASFDLLRMLEEMGRIFAERAKKRQIALVLRYAPDARRRFVGDAGRIRQILVNLVGNAIKFTERGHVLIGVEEDRSTPNEHAAMLRVTIEDTGIGIAPEAVTRLFERFAQADASTTRRFGGTGLGLAICKRLVELMGGQIGVTSRIGEGSMFWFTLRLQVDVSGLGARTAVPNAASAPIAPPARPRFRGRVLVADDSATNQRVAQLALEGIGCSVELAGNGAEALSLLQQRDYDLVFMDCEMPDVDGFEATREIRALEARLAREGPSPSHRHVPVIAMTAKVLAGDRERCLAAGMDDYLSKPVELGALIEKLRRWLPVASAPALDPAAIARLRTLASATNPALFARVVDAFRADAAKHFTAIETGAAENDRASLRRAAHALRGACLNVGATQMADACRALETAEETGGTAAAEVHSLVARLRAELQRVQAEIELELGPGAADQ
ncbi:MAG: ATP-binding protein [Acidobacteriota bacterium]|nr:ATP-binding protein [Acidobacteriota bacterium]